MTDQQINIAIAEACGWRKVDVGTGMDENGKVGPAYEWRRFTEGGDEIWQLAKFPNYCHDLNAMHEVETKMIQLDKREEYRQRLTEITQKNRIATIAWTNITATARQRAEAFLRTLGRWVE